MLLIEQYYFTVNYEIDLLEESGDIENAYFKSVNLGLIADQLKYLFNSNFN
jgi:hypothetical protein